MRKSDKNQNLDTKPTVRIQLSKKSKALLLQLAQNSPQELPHDQSILPLLRHSLVQATYTITKEGREKAQELTKELEDLKDLVNLIEALPTKPEEETQCSS